LSPTFVDPFGGDTDNTVGAVVSAPVPVVNVVIFCVFANPNPFVPWIPVISCTKYEVLAVSAAFGTTWIMFPAPTRLTVAATAPPPPLGFSVTVVEFTVDEFSPSLNPISITSFVDTPVAPLTGLTLCTLGAIVLVFATVVNDPS
jgi:hypothetical protein